MVNVREDLTGRKFGKLTVLEQAEDYIHPNGSHRAQWKCQCDCASKTIITVVSGHLKSGATLSCGCLRNDKLIQRNIEKRKFNKYSDKLTDEHGEYYIGWTTNTNKEFYIDAEDFNIINKYSWCEVAVSNKRYHKLQAYDCSNGKLIFLHQILGFKNYDHVDRNPLNNRRHNLRQVTYVENAQNRSIRSDNISNVTGVGFRTKNKCWRARIQVNGNPIYIGDFNDKDEAIRARLLAEQKYFGEFAPQKHLFEKYGIEVNSNE